jgi:hypothetical protein
MRRLHGVSLQARERRSSIGGSGGPPPRALAYRWLAGEGLSLTGSRVDSWTDVIGGRTFLPVTPATSEFFSVPAHPGFRGAPVVQNNLTAAVSRAIAGVGADWIFLHSGAGMTVAWIAAATAAINLNTSGGGATAAGFNLRATSTDLARSRAGNGAATMYDLLSGSQVNRSVASLWCTSHKSSNSPQVRLLRGTNQIVSGSELVTPSSGNAAQGLEWRADVTTECSTAELLIYTDALTDAELSVLSRYAALRYGAVTG